MSVIIPISQDVTTLPNAALPIPNVSTSEKENQVQDIRKRFLDWFHRPDDASYLDGKKIEHIDTGKREAEGASSCMDRCCVDCGSGCYECCNPGWIGGTACYCLTIGTILLPVLGIGVICFMPGMMLCTAAAAKMEEDG